MALVVKSWRQADAVLCELGALGDAIAAQRGGIEARVKAALEKIEPQLAGLREAVERAERQAAERIAALEVWVLDHEEELDPGTLSRQLAHGRVAIRQDPPSLQLAEGRQWEQVIAAIAKLPRRFRDKWLRRKIELAKVALRTDLQDAGEMAAAAAVMVLENAEAVPAALGVVLVQERGVVVEADVVEASAT